MKIELTQEQLQTVKLALKNRSYILATYDGKCSDEFVQKEYDKANALLEQIEAVTK